MKYIKTFEDLQEEPQVGDYILINIDISASMMKKRDRDDIMNFVNNTIGKVGAVPKEIKDIWGHKSMSNIVVLYVDKYNQKSIPKNIKKWFTPTHGGYIREFQPDRVVAFAKTIDELKSKIAVYKYNL